ncbi:hypothetical protein QTP70_009861 [Hemibagrus guttatus]|uniref:Uncharacterized protein n=1 Tax=Hemibagrus guttatus TaxID=175788 RepID=A0AAE0RBS6_9TELE|nr:hypothetical protein QTP70_009861 [Hemibagrus guttatus]
MPPGCLPGEVFWACPTRKRPRGRPRTRWRDYVFRLAWERLGVPPEELEEVTGERECATLVEDASRGCRSLGVGLEHILKHLLKTNIHQQVASQEVAQSLELATKELQELRRGPHPTAVPLPEPGHAAQHLLMKMTVEDEHKGWRRRDWADLVAPFLTGDAQLAYYTLDVEKAREYEQVKGEILARCGRSPVNAAGDFHR